MALNSRAREAELERRAPPADRPDRPARAGWAALRQFRAITGNKATAKQSPLLKALSMKSPIPKERLRVGNWIVQRLYNYAVNETVEL